VTTISIGILITTLWILLLRILTRANLNFWKFLAGSVGMFVILFIFVRPIVATPLSRIVAIIASIPGKIGDMYQAYYKYSTIFINAGDSAITMQIDFECSGVIEITAFLSLLSFYKVYSVAERITVGILGTMFIVLSNALRIIAICMIIYFFGTDMYYVAHTIIGRLLFYVLSVALYFYVFTRPQIIKQKVGLFGYDSNK